MGTSAVTVCEGTPSLGSYIRCGPTLSRQHALVWVGLTTSSHWIGWKALPQAPARFQPHAGTTPAPPTHRIRTDATRPLHPQASARAQRGHSANYCVVYPRNTPENHPPTEVCMIHSKGHRGCRIQDPGTHGYRWWKKANFRTARAQRTVRPPEPKRSAPARDHNTAPQNPRRSEHPSTGVPLRKRGSNKTPACAACRIHLARPPPGTQGGEGEGNGRTYNMQRLHS